MRLQTRAIARRSRITSPARLATSGYLFAKGALDFAGGTMVNGIVAQSENALDQSVIDDPAAG